MVPPNNPNRILNGADELEPPGAGLNPAPTQVLMIRLLLSALE